MCTGHKKRFTLRVTLKRIRAKRSAASYFGAPATPSTSGVPISVSVELPFLVQFLDAQDPAPWPPLMLANWAAPKGGSLCQTGGCCNAFAKQGGCFAPPSSAPRPLPP